MGLRVTFASESKSFSMELGVSFGPIGVTIWYENVEKIVVYKAKIFWLESTSNQSNGDVINLLMTSPK